MSSIKYIIPKNWTAIDLTGDIEAQIARVSVRFTKQLSADQKGPVIQELRNSLRNRVGALSSKDVTLLLVEIEPVNGISTGGSLAFREFPELGREDPANFLVALASQYSNTEVLDAGSLLLMRVEEESTLVDIDMQKSRQLLKNMGQNLQEFPDLPGQARSRHILYFLGDPDDTENWIMAMGSILVPLSEEEPEIGDAIVELYDAIVQSVRFRS